MKLIYWNEAPIGVMTNCGKLLSVHPYDNTAEIYDHTQEFADRYCIETTVSLSLAPADQQPWLVYEEGITVVPEWAKCEYRVTEAYNYGDSSELQTITDEQQLIDVEREIAHYKIVGLKAGWTDNPREVTE